MQPTTTRNLNSATLESSVTGGVHWFCVHCQPKHEHIAASRLRTQQDIEVFLPQIRFRRATARGPVWFTEALFPGYLFAEFHFERMLPLVRSASGVRNVVSFGQRFPTIEREIIHQLKAQFEGGDLRVISDAPEPGEWVDVVQGPFAGMKGLVDRVLPAADRVKVLLEILGRSTAVELKLNCVLPEVTRLRISD